MKENISDLYVEINQLNKGKHRVVVNMPNDSMISKLEFDLKKIQNNLKNRMRKSFKIVNDM